MEVLEFLWEQGSATVRQVNDRINQRWETGYTTTLKIMQIMHAKGMLERIEEGRTHIYTPLVGERQTRQKLLDRFLETTFRSEEHTSELQSLMRISYAVFCLQKKNTISTKSKTVVQQR